MSDEMKAVLSQTSDLYIKEKTNNKKKEGRNEGMNERRNGERKGMRMKKEQAEKKETTHIKQVKNR